MIGWWIVVTTQTPEERNTSADRQPFILATWEVGVEGLAWIEQLIAEGHATKLRGDGYPNIYVGSAAAVLPLVADGPPRVRGGITVIGDDYVMPPGWRGEVQVHKDRIAACPPGQPLTIEAWDLS